MYKILIYITIVASVGGYFLYSQNKINSLNRQAAEVSSVLEGYKDANTILRASITKQAELLAEVRQSNIAAEQQAIRLQRVFEGSDINYLSQQKPELIERLINQGTQNVFNEIERITNQ
jgi:hypothetical protein